MIWISNILFSDIFSSHTSSSFSPSLSDDIGTPNSIVNETDLNIKAETDLNQEKNNKEKCENGKNVEKTKQDGSRNGEGSYHCQFCDKTFPRLGYLKKHEQVSVLVSSFYIIKYLIGDTFFLLLFEIFYILDQPVKRVAYITNYACDFKHVFFCLYAYGVKLS